MELKKFKLVALRDGALWHNKEVPAGTAVLVLAAETADEIRWFFSRINFSAWAIEEIKEPPQPTAESKKGKA